MEIKNLVGVNMEALTNCFNKAFANYFVEIHATIPYLRARWKAARVRYDLSCGVFVDGRPVAFIIHGVDHREGQLTAHNVGTGVIPSERGQGLVGQMYDYLLPRLEAAGVSCCSLEVICENARAIRVYEKAGFQISKTLPCFRGTLQLARPTADDLEVRLAAEPNWTLYARFVDSLPGWDNEVSAIQLSDGQYEIYELLEKSSAVRGYIAVNPSNGNIAQFGIHPAFRRKGYGRRLFAELCQRIPTMRAINVDQKATAVTAFLEALGFECYLSQYEMKRML